MSAKFISNQLISSGRFAVGQKNPEASENETSPPPPLKETEEPPTEPPSTSPPPPPVSSDPPTEATAKLGLKNILQREHGDIRRNAVEQSIRETIQSRREILEILRETTSEIRQRTETLEAYRKLFESTATNIADLSSTIDSDTLGTARQAIDNARIEVARYEKEVMNRSTSSRSPEKVEFSLDHLSFIALAKIGLGLLWPVVLAILATAVIGAMVLFTLFSVN